MAPKEKGVSVIVTELPPELTRREIQEYFNGVGQVKRCHMVRDKDGASRGLAYIVFANAESAVEAVDKLDNSEIKGKNIRVKFSRKNDNAQRQGTSDGDSGEAKEEEETKITKKKKPNTQENKNSRRHRNGRIIIRNLSFKADEKIVEDHFSPYGKISEVSILRKKDGLMVGCAFVQFSTKAEALAAIQECNMKPLLGRTVAVDLAVGKEKFATVGVKQEEVKVEEVKLSDHEGEEDYNETHTQEDHKVKMGSIKVKDERMSSDDEDDDDFDDSGMEDESGDESQSPSKTPLDRQHTKDASKDVAEGRTLFIKNLSFDATEKEVRDVLRKFGQLKYVLLCIDRLTEHPRGTAFAQFKEQEAANECLAAESDAGRKQEFLLHDRAMHIMKAISRQQLDTQHQDSTKKTAKDKRNLYLAREGFVREGTMAASGLSRADVELRTRRERVKRKMLQNLHIFVSPTRLCINNIPPNTNNKQLRAIFKKHAPEGAQITECRIMKNLREVDEGGRAESKGYGFLSFTEHEHALTALRNVNNNPTIFTTHKRPVVEFSLENQAVLQAREKRKVKSKEKNPVWINKNTPANDHKPVTKVGPAAPAAPAAAGGDETLPSYMGSKGDPSKPSLPTNIGPKIRQREAGKGKISRKQFRKAQQDRVLGRKRHRQPQSDLPSNKKIRTENQPTPSTTTEGGEKKTRKAKKKKITKHMQTEMKSEKAFDSMVQKYKQKIASASAAANSKKWYED